MDTMLPYQIVEVNEVACPNRKALPMRFRTAEEASAAAASRMGDPSRKRRFYALEVHGPDGFRHEVVRGTA